MMNKRASYTKSRTWLLVAVGLAAAFVANRQNHYGGRSPGGSVDAFVTVTPTSTTTAVFQHQRRTLPAPLRPSGSQQPPSSPPPQQTTGSLLLFASGIEPAKELLQQELPSPSVVQAVEKTNQRRVIAADVASTAGISLSQAKRELTTLAALSQADLQVSDDGDIIYQFPNNINQKLAENSRKYQAIQVFRKVWPTVFWGIRVSFGVALLASLVAIFSTILFIQSSSSSSDNDRRRGGDRGFGGGGGGMGWYWGPSPFDVFYYRPYGAYGYYGSRNYDDPDEMGFFESVFSYLFGDGNPNLELEVKRLSLAAQLIRDNQGAVTAEQLAPFCDDLPSSAHDDKGAYVDESFVLPIVSALGGEPTVTEDGEIVYVFPELMKSAAADDKDEGSRFWGRGGGRRDKRESREAFVLKRAGMSPRSKTRDIVQVLNYNGISTRGVVDKNDLINLLEDALPPMSPLEEEEWMDNDPMVLQEREWKFSLAPGLNKFLAGGLGVVNFGGALYLGNLLGQYALYDVRLPSYFGTVQALYPLLLGYAILFNAIPLLRNVWIQNQNKLIRQRNERRKTWQAALGKALTGNSRIAKKLQAAAKFKQQQRTIGGSKDTIVFDTSKPLTDNKAVKERYEKQLEDFDKQLQESEDKNAFQ